MKKSLLLVALLLLFCSFLQDSSMQMSAIPEVETLTLVFAGDIMGHSPQYKAAYSMKRHSFNYNVCFDNIKKYLAVADWAFANLEVPIAGKPYSGYPNFSSPDALLDGLKYAGYNIIETANNHALDRNKSGLERTIRQLDKHNLLHLGTYIDKMQRDSTYPLIIEKKGVKLAILNCTFGTNDHVATDPNIINYIDTLEIIRDIQRATELGSDLKIMTIHWGTEYELQANSTQRHLAQFFVNHGIRLIIGSHPHVVQNAEILYTKDSIPVPVYYSVGNSLSNQHKLNTNGGILVKVDINTRTKLISGTSYLPVYVYRGVLNKVYQFHLLPTVDFIKNPFQFPINKADSTSLMIFDSETRSRLHNVSLFQ
jgi:Putative enzyme of poly-gamma-glutamate biosynthesis (capsule formation)